MISMRLWAAQAVWLSVLCSAACCPAPPAVALADSGGGNAGGLGHTIPATEWCSMNAQQRAHMASTEPEKLNSPYKASTPTPQPMPLDQLAQAGSVDPTQSGTRALMRRYLIWNLSL